MKLSLVAVIIVAERTALRRGWLSLRYGDLYDFYV